MSSTNFDNSLRKLLSPERIEAEFARRELTRRRNKLTSYFPAEGALRRELYPKHLAFFAAGREYKERAFIAGNRCGKTLAGAYEMTLHLTGRYPDWWQGRRFDSAIEAWAAGDTNLTVRDIIQKEMLGQVGEHGTGMIPHDALVHTTSKPGVAGAVDSAFVRHATGKVSVLGFKSYAEGRANFQGTSKAMCWFDEEPPQDVYLEALMRTMVVAGCPEGGAMMLTFTPLSGWSDVVDSFLGADATLAA